MGCSSGMMGFGICAGGQAYTALQHQFDWKDDPDKVDSQNKLLSTFAMGGMALGCLFGGSMLSYGKRPVIIMCNIICIITSVTSCFLNWWLMVASRTIFCFFAGVLVVAAPKVIEETVPSHLIEYGFGSSTGSVINL